MTEMSVSPVVTTSDSTFDKNPYMKKKSKKIDKQEEPKTKKKSHFEIGHLIDKKV